MIRLFVCVSTFLLLGPALASPLDVAAFLKSAAKTAAVEAREKGKSDLETNTLDLIEGVQINTEHPLGADNRLEVGWELGMKVVPRGVQQFLVEKRMRGHQERWADGALKKEIGRALEERYLALIAHAHATSRARIFRERLALTEREIKVLTSATRASEMNARDLLKAREGLHQTKQDLLQAESTASVSAANLRRLDPSLKETELKMEDLAAPTDLLPELPKAEGALTGPEVLMAREGADFAREELTYGRVKTDRAIDAIELKAKENRSGEPQLRLELTWNVPGFGGRDVASRERMRKAADAQVEWRRAESASLLTAESLRASVERAVAVFRLSNGAGGDALPSKTINDRLRKLAGREDPALVFWIDKVDLEDRLRALDATAEALKSSIQYLNLVGTLAENPERNYLASGRGP